MITLKAAPRRSVNEQPRITVESNIDFELVVRYGKQEKRIAVISGKHTY